MLRKAQNRNLELIPGLGLPPEKEQALRDQVAWIVGRQQKLAAVQPAPMRLNIADMLRDIGPVVYPGDPFRQAGLRQAWNVLSADAHALVDASYGAGSCRL